MTVYPTVYIAKMSHLPECTLAKIFTVSTCPCVDVSLQCQKLLSLPETHWYQNVPMPKYPSDVTSIPKSEQGTRGET